MEAKETACQAPQPASNPPPLASILQRPTSHGTAGSVQASSLHAPAAVRASPATAIAVPASNPNSVPAVTSDGPVVAVPPQQSPVAMAGVQMGSPMVMGGIPVKRKRGRPRKYVDGASPPPGTMALALAPLAAAGPFSPPSSEKKRGRPPGSGKKQQLAALGAWLAGSAGQGFTPHVITIAAGEDVATRIMSFSQIGPRAICVLSANGAISNVTLRQPSTSGGTVTYEGRFEILSLSGSFLLTENGNTKSRSGGLSVSLAGPDGRVIGGGVAGLLVAATPVQVVVGSFIAESRRNVVVRPPTSNSDGAVVTGQNATGVTTSPLLPHPMKIEVVGSKSPESPSLNESPSPKTSSDNMQSQGMTISWPNNQGNEESNKSADINVSLPGG